MEEIGSIVFAHDSDHKAVHIDSADRKRPYYCPLCGQPLEIRRGEIRAHHFSHYPKDSERIKDYPAHRDDWHYEPKTEWHVGWQLLFPAEMVEQRVSKDGEYHIADVLIPEEKLVIEFQHSKISYEEFEARNRFYLACGYKLIWVFDFIQEFKDKELRLKEGSDMYGEMVKGRYPALSNEGRRLDSKLSFFFQIHDDTDNEKDHLLRIKAVYNSGTAFVHGKKAMSISDLTSAALTSSASLFEETYHPPVEPQTVTPYRYRKTLKELWKPIYRYMVVEKEIEHNGKKEKKCMYIFHSDHSPNEMKRDASGKIVGYYKNPMGEGYIGRQYVVWDADEPIWRFIKASNKNK